MVFVLLLLLLLPGAEALVRPARLASLHAERGQLLDQLATVSQQLDAAQREEDGDDRFVDFGYLSKSAGVPNENGGVPTSFLDLAVRNLGREAGQLSRAVRSALVREADEVECVDCSASEMEASAALRRRLSQLTLSNEAVWAREKRRPPIEAPVVLLGPYYALCFALDVFFEARPIPRFWFLETVARMPYFSYVSLLHLYESLGWWRRSAEAKRVHFAEEWNEFHHLLIMESLGGDQRWADRFLAQHAAIVYFWLLVGLWFLSPSISYNFSELIEAHAVDTYEEFAHANEAALRELPAPAVAREYYHAEDLRLFDEFQTSAPRGTRRPHLANLCAEITGLDLVPRLTSARCTCPPPRSSTAGTPPPARYDVFCAIRDDEAEHVSTMQACQDPEVIVRAPRLEGLIAAAASSAVAATALLTDPLGLGGELPPGVAGGFGSLASDGAGLADGLAGLVAGLAARLSQLELRLFDLMDGLVDEAASEAGELIDGVQVCICSHPVWLPCSSPAAPLHAISH